MSRTSLNAHRLSQKYEYGIRDFGAALLRNRIWVLLFTSLGIAVVGFARIVDKPPASATCLIINTSSGPKIYSKQYDDISKVNKTKEFYLPKSPYVAVPVQSALDEIIIRLQQNVRDLTKGSRLRYEDIIIEPLRVARLRSATQLSACISPKSDLEGRISRDFLEALMNKYKNDVIAEYGNSPGFMPPRKSWLVLVTSSSNTSNRSIYILGFIGGLVFGLLGALYADYRKNRVFNPRQILDLLGYPLRAKLPCLPWDTPGAQAEISLLASQLDSTLYWLILSIGTEHPLGSPLVHTLQRLAPDIDLRHLPPLLSEHVSRPHPLRPVGILVLCESGFNSAAALRESNRVLSSLSYVEDVIVVMAGYQLPPELRM